MRILIVYGHFREPTTVVQGNNKHPLRSLVYLSELKLTQILDTIDEQTRRSIATELKIDLKLLSLTLSSTSVDRSLRNRSRVARLTVAERYIRQYLPVGDIASDRDWIAGEAEMGWKPLQDGKTVLFCGEFRGQAGPVLVTLGGSVSNVLGYPTSEEQTGSYASTIREAVSGNGQPERFWHDLETTARQVGAMPQPVRFLARVLARHDPDKDPFGSRWCWRPRFMSNTLSTQSCGSQSRPESRRRPESRCRPSAR